MFALVYQHFPHYHSKSLRSTFSQHGTLDSPMVVESLPNVKDTSQKVQIPLHYALQFRIHNALKLLRIINFPTSVNWLKKSSLATKVVRSLRQVILYSKIPIWPLINYSLWRRICMSILFITHNMDLTVQNFLYLEHRKLHSSSSKPRRSCLFRFLISGHMHHFMLVKMVNLNYCAH